MPFAGTADEAHAALGSLTALELGDDDELILADNCGITLDRPSVAGAAAAPTAPVRVIDARGERSPAHARNAGAAAAGDDAQWILFLDADTVAPPDLLDRYFAEPIADDVGAVAGGVTAAPTGPSAGIVARYGVHKNFLDSGSHLAHPFLPRAAAANLLVRRAAFDAVGGFFEGLRAAEDTDFSWRLQRAGWALAGRPSATVGHRYRASLHDLRHQWRGYAAGRAWLGRRYDGFDPQPALRRAAARTFDRGARGPADTTTASAERPASVAFVRIPARDRVRFAALDLILGVEELIGFALSNRPVGAPAARLTPVRVLVADEFPIGQVEAGDGRSLPGLVVPGRGLPGPVRIEAGRRADRAASSAGVTVVYREDDGPLDRARALTMLIARRPGGLLAARDRDAPSRAALAPAAGRLLADPAATTLEPSSPDPVVRAATQRLARLAGRKPPRGDGWREMLTRRAKSAKRTPATGDPKQNPRR